MKYEEEETRKEEGAGVRGGKVGGREGGIVMERRAEEKGVMVM